MIDKAGITQQINRVVGTDSFDFWLINAQNNCDNLLRFLETTELPVGAEVFTSEGIYPGPHLESLKRNECINEETDRELKKAERLFLTAFAKELQGVEVFNGVGQQILRLSKQKKIRLWLGAPYLDPTVQPNRLYNAYLLIENGEIRFVHKKKFLWDGGRHRVDSEIDVFDVIGKDRGAPISVTSYDGIFENRAYLICQEADAFFCPAWRKRPTHIPEVRKAKPDFVIIPAQWFNKVGAEEKYLQKIALSIARRIKEPVDKLSAVRKQGCLVLVTNAHGAYICGPVDEKKIKARVYASQTELGWLRVNSKGITQGEF